MTDGAEWPSLSHRLGGRWAISWQAILISAPPAVIAILIGSGAASGVEVMKWFAVGLIAVSALALWTYALHLTVFRNRHQTPVALPWVVAGALLSGIVFSSVAIITTRVFGLTPNAPVLVSLTATALIAAWWGMTLQLLLDARWRFAEQRSVLIDRALQQQVATLQEADVIARMRMSIEQEVESELSAARAAVDRQLIELQQSAQPAGDDVAELLRDTATNTVRPLSHRLAARALHVPPRPSLITVVANIVRRQPFRPLALVLVYLVSTAPADVRELGVRTGLFIAFTSVISIVVITTVANRLMIRQPQRHALIFLTTVGVIQVTSLAFAPVRASLADQPLSGLDVLLNVVVSILIILLTSGFGSWRSAHHDMLATVSADLAEQEKEALVRGHAIADVAREASRILHGAIQTKLVNCAVAIDNAQRTGDIEAVNRALLQARAVLEQPVQINEPRSDASLVDEVSRKCGLWSGLCTIDIDVLDGVGDLRGSVARDAGRVVEEALANAVRHGAASSMQVCIRADAGDALVIVVDDNGTGPGRGRSGMGTNLLDDVSSGDWSLTPGISHGSRLTVTMALAAR